MDNSAGKDGGTSMVRLRAMIALVLFLAGGLLLYFIDEQSRYLWIKSLHVIAVISWMAGLLYMPRLFIYHTDSEIGGQTSETFKVMERRLLVVIMWPAMILSWLFGLWMAWVIYGFQGGWLHIKLLFVVGLTVTHFHQMRAVAAFGRDERVHSQRYWRLLNEVPTLLMILIVIMVIVKPFS